MLWSSSSSPTLGNNHDQEEYSNHPNKKSVLAKVKERAKKLRHSLSGKKKHGNDLHDDNTTPSWGVSLDDLDEEDDDPEYLGAPSNNINNFICKFMILRQKILNLLCLIVYESELAPETYREYARQHPRASPVVSEKHIMPGSIKHETDQQENDRAMSRNKTMARSASLKLAPSHSVTSKFAGLTVKTPETQETGDHTALSDSAIHLGDMKKLGESSLIGKQFSSSPQKWDKGVSVKEYFLNKLEPGEDERALSQAITDAISPRKTARETGVVEMVKEAVTSFFRHEETSSSVTTKTTTNSSSTLLVSPKPTFNKENSLSSTNSPTSKLSFYASANSSPVPISTNAHPGNLVIYFFLGLKIKEWRRK